MTGILSKIAGFANRFGDELINPTSGLGKAAMWLNAASGNDLGRAQLGALQNSREDQDQQLKQQLAQIQLKKLMQPEIKEAGGGLYSIDPNTSMLTQLAAPPPKDPPALQQNFDWYKGLSPEDRALAGPMLPGFAFTPEGVHAYVDRASRVADVQGAARERYRAPSGGGAPAAIRSVGGKAYYKVNGRWYDNPEGQ